MSVNDMDLRIVKTKSLIKNAFFELRKKSPLEKITVKELCQNAQINKSTFYSHYNDIFDLSDTLENEVVDNILSNVQHPEYVLLKSDIFTKEIFREFMANEPYVSVLFAESRRDILVDKLKCKVKATIIKNQPQYKNNTSLDIILSYAINGGYHAFTDCQKENSKQVIEIVAKINRSINEIYEKLASNNEI